MRVLVQDLLATVLAVLVETVKVMARDLSELELVLSPVHLKMNEPLKGKEQDLHRHEDEIEKMIETRKTTEKMKGKEAKVALALLIGVASLRQSLVQGLLEIAADRDQEAIHPGEDKWIGAMTRMAIVYM